MLASRTPSGSLNLPAASGSLLDRLRRQGYSLPADCGGQGTCGKCQVRFISAPPAPEETETAFFTSAELEAGWRLACRVCSGAETQLAYNPDWEVHFRLESCAKLTPQSYGLAVDLGTTGLVLGLVEIASGKVATVARGFNPQRAWGADVMTRLVAAREPEALGQMQESLMRAVITGRELLCAQLNSSCQTLTEKSLAVGNTAMLHLAAGIPEDTLSVFPFRSPLEEPRRLIVNWNGLSLPLAGPLQSFIGSDHLAVLEYLQPHRRGSEATLIMDLGTNSEISLWDGVTYWATSCAAGPAFEGGGISCGVPATPQAATAVEVAGEQILLHPQPQEAKIGLCGSALISLLAALRRDDRLSSAGRLRDGRAITLQATPALTLTQKDVRALQLAKGAIHCGLILLARKANIPLQEIGKVVITGAFARSLGTEDLKEIGLIPQQAGEVTFVNDGALLGAAQALAPPGEPFAELRTRIKVINLVEEADFQEQFIEGLELKPILA